MGEDTYSINKSNMWYTRQREVRGENMELKGWKGTVA